MSMTKEQEEAIEILKQDLELAKKEDVIDIDVLTGYLEIALNLIQEQQEENKKKDKIIEEMARFMTNKNIDEDICRYQVVEHCKDEKYGVTTNVCINCIKQYFERKVNSSEQN